jgi:26S proteasome regulatory subunit N7
VLLLTFSTSKYFLVHVVCTCTDYDTRDLARFIAADRIPCTIDRVKGIIETNRPDDKNKQYTDVVKQGDQLITKLQKYGQAVRLRGSERG